MDFYRGMDREALSVAYNNRAVVPGWEDMMRDWRSRGDAIYQSRACERDLAYGPGPRQRMDLFPSPIPKSPTVLFLHGGYWQWNDKEGQSFIAEGLLHHGLNVAIGEYSLAPAASMAEICAEADAMIDFLSAELSTIGNGSSALWLCGISTGAHLTALVLPRAEVRGALLMSGIYDLEPIRLSPLNDAIRMSPEEARRLSPLHRPAGRPKPLVLAFGALERPEIQRQSRDYAAALVAQGWDLDIVPVPGENHFSIMEALAGKDGALATRLAGLTQCSDDPRTRS